MLIGNMKIEDITDVFARLKKVGGEEPGILYENKRAISARTFERYIVNAKRYIYPYMGNYQPQDVSTDLLQTFLGEMLDRGYVPDTVKHVKYRLRQYFEYCIDEQIIDGNPADKVRLQAHERKAKSAAEGQEYKAIPEELRDEFLQNIARLMNGYGVSSIDELIKTADEGAPTRKRRGNNAKSQ